MQPQPPPQPPYPHPYPYPPPQAPKSSNTVIFIIVGIVGGVFVLGILAAVAIPSFLKYEKKSKSSEAELHLKELSRNLKRYYAENGALPQQSSGPTPPMSCCNNPGFKCPPDPTLWMAPPWRDLDFSVDEPTYYQYGYDVAGDSFTITATGDLDCDGEPGTYSMSGRAVAGDLQLDPIVKTGKE